MDPFVGEQIVTDGAGLAGEHVPPVLPTETFAVAVEVPPGPVAVRVYVVVAEGETETLPDVGCDPMPLSMVTDVALVVLHVNVELCPAVMLAGFAVKLIVGTVDVVTVKYSDCLMMRPALSHS